MKRIIFLVIFFLVSAIFAQTRDTLSIDKDIKVLQDQDSKIVQENKTLAEQLTQIKARLFDNAIRQQELFSQFQGLLDERKKLINQKVK